MSSDGLACADYKFIFVSRFRRMFSLIYCVSSLAQLWLWSQNHSFGVLDCGNIESLSHWQESKPQNNRHSIWIESNQIEIADNFLCFVRRLNLESNRCALTSGGYTRWWWWNFHNVQIHSRIERELIALCELSWSRKKYIFSTISVALTMNWFYINEFKITFYVEAFQTSQWRQHFLWWHVKFILISFHIINIFHKIPLIANLSIFFHFIEKVTGWIKNSI